MDAIVVDCLASGKGEKKTTLDAIGAGPRSVSGILESFGIHTRIAEAESILSGSTSLSEYEVLLISGMTCDLTAIRKVISKWSGGPVILGGPVTSNPYESLTKTGADIAVIGEGEQTLVELLKFGLVNAVIPHKAKLLGLRGIAFRDQKILVNPLRPVIPRIVYDGFTPSVNAITGYRLYRSARVYVEVLRGCSNYNRSILGGNCIDCKQCTDGPLEKRYDCPKGIPPGCGYCSVPSLYGPPKSRAAKNILSEIKKLLNFGVTRIVLSAPCFLDYGRDLLVEPEPLTNPQDPEPNYEEIESLLHSLSQLSQISDSNASIMIENLKASLVTEKASKILGKYLSGTPVSIGFETGSEKHARMLGRPSTGSETLQAIEKLQNEGLKPYVYFIHGLPGQNEESTAETIKAIKKSKVKGAERIILYRFQSLPMSTFSGYPSGPPSATDNMSNIIHEAAEKINMSSKRKLLGKKLRVVIAEHYRKEGKTMVAYPLKHGPVVLLKGEFEVGRVLDAIVTGIQSARIVKGQPVLR